VNRQLYTVLQMESADGARVSSGKFLGAVEIRPQCVDRIFLCFSPSRSCPSPTSRLASRRVVGDINDEKMIWQSSHTLHTSDVIARYMEATLRFHRDQQSYVCLPDMVSGAVEPMKLRRYDSRQVTTDPG